jgi:hypothetical protein
MQISTFPEALPVVLLMFLSVTEESKHIDPGGDDTLCLLNEGSVSNSETFMSHYIYIYIYMTYLTAVG